MMKLVRFICVCCAFWAFVFSANADTASSNIATALRASLKKTLPELVIDQVNISPISGVYEVISGRKVFYVDTSGRYAMLGNLVDLTAKQSLTDQKSQSLNFIDWNKLPTKIAIVNIIGNGERKIAVFTDPDCPFCKRLDADVIAKQKNLTVYYFLYPLAMHANAEDDSKRILCAENPDKTYLDWMVNDKKLPIQNKCGRLVNLEKMKQVGAQVVGVEATPTIVLPNGQLVSGLIPADYLSKLITDTSPAPIAKTASAPKSAIANAKPSAESSAK